MEVLATAENTKVGDIVYYYWQRQKHYAVVGRIDGQGVHGAFCGDLDAAMHFAGNEGMWGNLWFGDRTYPMYKYSRTPERKPGDEIWRVIHHNGIREEWPITPGADPVAVVGATAITRGATVIKCNDCTMLRVE